MPLDARGMKRLTVSPLVAFALITAFAGGATFLILHEISLVNFQFVDYPKDLLN